MPAYQPSAERPARAAWVLLLAVIVLLGFGATWLWRQAEMQRRVAELAAQHRLPDSHEFRSFVEGGGLMSYGANTNDLSRRSATFVDKILKGAQPGNLPVQEPSKFELVINLKTAKALGLTIPQPLLLRADRLIQ